MLVFAQTVTYTLIFLIKGRVSKKSLFVSFQLNKFVSIIRGVPIIGSTDILATDRVIFTTSVIGTIITQPADINTDYSACETYFI